jgi:hypothetical protein
MFCGICASLPLQVVKTCHEDFLKEKGQITRLPKDATPKKIVFFCTKTSSVFILIFIQTQRVAHND